MAGFAAFDGIGAVELFEQDDEGEFVLQSERGESPDRVGFLTKFGGVSIGGSDKERNGFDAGVARPLSLAARHQ